MKPMVVVSNDHQFELVGDAWSYDLQTRSSYENGSHVAFWQQDRENNFDMALAVQDKAYIKLNFKI